MAHLKLSMEVSADLPWGGLEICGCAVNSWGKLRLCELVHKVKEHGYTGMDVVFSKIQEIPPEPYTRTGRLQADLDEPASTWPPSVHMLPLSLRAISTVPPV